MRFKNIDRFLIDLESPKSGYSIDQLGSSGLLFNTIFKGLIIGGLYALRIYIKNWKAKHKYRGSYRSERIYFYMVESSKIFKSRITRTWINWFSFIFVFFIDIDNAYFQWFNKFLEDYYNEFKKK